LTNIILGSVTGRPKTDIMIVECGMINDN
jgi:hypothetical protein